MLSLLGLCSGCLVYTNRVSYSAHTYLPSAPTHPAVSPVNVSVSLRREYTAGMLPFVFTLGEKGDYSFSVDLHRPTVQPYQGGLIRAFSIVSPAGVLFQSYDSTFVRYVPATPYPGPTKSYPDSFSQYYKSPYAIAIADSSNRLSFTLDYTLITTEGKRESYHLEQPLRVDRDKGFALFSN